MAIRTISVAGGNYDATTAWDEGVVPTSADDVVARAGGDSGSLTVNVASAALTMNFTNYVNTLTLGANLTVSGSITLVAGMTFTPSTYTVTVGTGITSTITTGGKEFYNLSFRGINTITLSDDVTVNGTFDCLYANDSGSTVNGNHIYVKGNITFSDSTTYPNRLGGTTELVINGTGAQSIDGVGTSLLVCGGLRLNTTISKASGTLTFLNKLLYNGTLTCSLSGTGAVNMGTSHIQIWNTSTINSTGMTFYKLTFYGIYTVTLNSDLTVTNTLDFMYANGNGMTINGAYNLHAQGDITFSDSNTYPNTPTGTATLLIDGTAVQTFTANGHLGIGMNWTINKTGGSLTLVGTVKFYNSKTLTYTAGTTDWTTNSAILQITGACVLNTNGMSFYAISMGANIALTSNLTLTNNWTTTAGTLSGNYAVIFNGTSTVAGATTFYNLTINDGKATSLTQAQTFTNSNTFDASGSATNLVTLNSTAAGTQSNLTVTNGVSWANRLNHIFATDINSSGGSTIYYEPTTCTITNCTLWSGTEPIAAVGGYMSLNTKYW